MSHKICYKCVGCFVLSLVLKKMIFKVCLYIFAISLSSPLGKGYGPSWIPIIQGCFVLSLVEIDPVVLKKKIFKVHQFIFTISLLSPLWKGHGPSFEKLESPSWKDALCQVWLKYALWFLRRRLKCEKFTDRRMDNRQQVIRKAHLNLSSGELKQKLISHIAHLLKVYGQHRKTNRQKDDGQRVIRNIHMCFQLSLAKEQQ